MQELLSTANKIKMQARILFLFIFRSCFESISNFVKKHYTTQECNVIVCKLILNFCKVSKSMLYGVRVFFLTFAEINFYNEFINLFFFTVLHSFLNFKI